MNRSSFPVQEIKAELTKPHLSRTTWKFRMRGQRHPAGSLEVLLPGGIRKNRPWLFLCGLPRWFRGKASTCQCRTRGFDPSLGKMPWRRKWQPTPVFLPGESHGQRSLACYSPWGHKESDTTKVTKYIHTLFLCILGCSALVCQKSIWNLVSSIC